MKENRRRYERSLCLLWPKQREEIRRLSGELKLSQNEVVRRAMAFGLPILEATMKELAIDNDQINGIIREVNS